MGMKPGYKQTETGVIPTDWDVSTLGTLVDPARGIRYGIVQPGPFVHGGRLLIRGQDYSKGWVDESEMYRVGDIVEARYRKARVSCGDIVITIVGASTGRIEEVPDWLDKANLTQTTARVAIDPKRAFSGFVKYVLSSSLGEAHVANYVKGGAQPGLNCGDIEKFTIPLPPLPEQRAITTALSDVDAALAGVLRLIAKKRDLKQAVMQALLTGRVRLPGHSGKWRLKRLGEISTIQRGASPRPIESPIWFDDFSPVGWVRISDVSKSSMFLTKTTQRLSKLGVARSRPVEVGSLIMSIAATVGRPVITKIPCCIHDGFVVFTDTKVDKRFLYYVLRYIEPNWSQQGQTGSQMNINTKMIEGTKVLLPATDAEQSDIAKVLFDIDAEITTLSAQAHKTRLLKQAMMQELLTGRTRLSISKDADA